MSHVPLCVFLSSNLFIYLHMSLCVSVSVCVLLCAPPSVPRMSVQVGASGVGFQPNTLMGLQLGSGGPGGASVPWEQQLKVDLLNLIHLPVLLITQSNLAQGQVYVGAAAAGVLFRTISPPILSIPQRSMVREQGYLGVAAAGGQFGLEQGPHQCGFIAAGVSLWVGCRELVIVRLL